MNDQRQVLVRAETRRVSFSGVDGQDETLSYSGVTLIRVHAGRRSAEIWLPMGDLPSEVDDEALIAALRDAYLWRGGLN
ncbi:MAG TPA: hypothetical protein VGL47_06210 [Amycolatopsis sp.]|uniref:YcxB-like protein domain-containing protein n=1 Tax=Amycolatopsis nalaikhensis TaxID=715472 RepID=A0ABY8XIM2_9PSEU|nr:hypothetical protein [Amycolatopsis sp. 2-2]WIV55435.1 hypothetical protein QP939_42555 [Amycolatopsis sp. 2-2]